MIPLPAYINREAWDGFVEMRRAMPKSKPFTTRAATLILYELQRIKDAGHDPNAALDQSTLRGWADVWPAKDKQIEAKAGSGADKTRAYIDSMGQGAVPPPEHVVEKMRKLRRVA
jgi:hypothetical protein